MMKRKKAQNTLEYVLLVAALTLVAIYAANKIGSSMKSHTDNVENILNTTNTKLSGAIGN